MHKIFYTKINTKSTKNFPFSHFTTKAPALHFIHIQCPARLRYDFPFMLRFCRNFRKLSIKNTTKVENFPLSYDFSRLS